MGPEPVPGPPVAVQTRTEEDRNDPFGAGAHPVGVRTLEVADPVRERRLPCELWYPAAAGAGGENRDARAAPGATPLVVFSHSSGGGRRQSTFLCTHLATHGYAVAAVDHSEAVVPELARRPGETEADRRARQAAWIAGRVPDVRALIDHLLAGAADVDLAPDPESIAVAGHSFGGWTALATPDVDPRIRAVVALAPAGSSTPRPGILDVRLDFAWGRDVPTLYLAGDGDVSMPLTGVRELFERTPATRRMVVLRRADHLHFMDEVAALHDAVRAMDLGPELAWMADEMQPFDTLCSAADAHRSVRGLATLHLDAALRESAGARAFWAGDVDAALAGRGIDAFEVRS